MEEVDSQWLRMMLSNEKEGETLPVEMQKIIAQDENFLLFLISFLTFNILHEKSSSEVKKMNDTGFLKP